MSETGILETPSNALMFGSLAIDALKLGTANVNAVYLGSAKVYGKSSLEINHSRYCTATLNETPLDISSSPYSGTISSGDTLILTAGYREASQSLTQYYPIINGTSYYDVSKTITLSGVDITVIWGAEREQFIGTITLIINA